MGRDGRNLRPMDVMGDVTADGHRTRRFVTVTPVADVATLRRIAGDHPFVRTHGTRSNPFRAWHADGAVAWLTERRSAKVVSAHGTAIEVVALLETLLSMGVLDGVQRVSVPRSAYPLLPARLRPRAVDFWDFRWATSPPPRQPAEDRVVLLDDSRTTWRAINEVLDASLPDSSVRPGDARVRAWYGVWSAGEPRKLLACGADATAGEAGFIAGIAVHPEAQGQGLGTAVSAVLTRKLLGEFDLCTLGVMSDNAVAIRMYQRLGYTGASPRASGRLTTEPDRGGRRDGPAQCD